jgi:hypothetical protein
MPVMSERIEHRRLRAPSEDGGTLVDPPRSQVGELLEQSLSLGHELGDARQALIAAALAFTRQYRDCEAPATDGPLILAGHQPQLFHPGVWYKNFVLGGLAADHGGAAVNLLIDSDAMRSAAIRVPTGSVQEPHLQSIAFDRFAGDTPYEEQTIGDRGLFESFGERAAAAIGPLVSDPLIHEYWPIAIEQALATCNPGLAISQARHRLEGRWGLETLELPQSQLCRFDSYRRFALRLFDDAAKLREVYNTAAAEYRQVNHIRSKSHPVPDLAADGDWIESPFWIWTKEKPTRQHLFVRRTGTELELTDRAAVRVRLSGNQATAMEQLADLERRGIKLRTRALITTMFARLVLGDLFIHGIGGAKYDQVTDAIIRRFIGIEPPAYLTVTATLRLPIAHDRVTVDDLRLVDSHLRELEYHPERWLAETNGEAAALVAQKERWIATPQTIENGRERWHAIREVNASLQPHVESLRQKLHAERESLRQALRAEAVLSSREYAFCLYPERTLRDLVAQ